MHTFAHAHVRAPAAQRCPAGDYGPRNPYNRIMPKWTAVCAARRVRGAVRRDTYIRCACVRVQVFHFQCDELIHVCGWAAFGPCAAGRWYSPNPFPRTLCCLHHRPHVGARRVVSPPHSTSQRAATLAVLRAHQVHRHSDGHRQGGHLLLLVGGAACGQWSSADGAEHSGDQVLPICSCHPTTDRPRVWGVGDVAAEARPPSTWLRYGGRPVRGGQGQDRDDRIIGWRGGAGGAAWRQTRFRRGGTKAASREAQSEAQSAAQPKRFPLCRGVTVPINWPYRILGKTAFPR